MKKISLIVLFDLLIILNSCSVLTKSQVKNINAFATTARNYAHFPGIIIKKRADLVLEEKLVGVIPLSPDQIKVSITAAQKNYELQQRLADKFDLSLQLIQQYSGLLSKLSSANFVENLANDTSGLTNNLGNLVDVANLKLGNKIPADVGVAITKVIFLVGEKMTRAKQTKALKEFIPIGDTLIKITVENLIETLSTDLPDLLAGDKQQFINTYTNNILTKENKVDYNSLHQLLVALNDYDNVEKLRKECIKAAAKLSAAHSKLNESIHEKKEVKEIFSETQDFITSMKDLYKIFSQLSSGAQS